MHSHKPISEFLCYKYKGVRRIDQIQAGAERFAWKCRQYQNWKEVQNVEGDKQVLVQFAAALLDQGKLNIRDYGRISAIFYNIQRWRKDKEELAEEAEILPSWAELDTLLHVIKVNQKVMIQKLIKDVVGIKNIAPANIAAFFFGWSLLEMLKIQKIPNLPAVEFLAPSDTSLIEQNILALITFLYSSAGLNLPHKSPDMGIIDLIAATHRDLGFQAVGFNCTFATTDLVNEQTPKTVVIRYGSLSPLQVMNVREIEDHVDVIINERHVFVVEALKNPQTQILLEAVFAGYAEALQRLPAQKGPLEELTAYLGITLKRSSYAKI